MNRKTIGKVKIMANLSFSLKLEELSINITDAEGTEQVYTIRELTGEQRDRYLNTIGGRMKFNSAGKMAGLNNYKDLQSGFLALCIYDNENKLVPVKTLQSWPASVLEEIFKIAQKLSGMDKGIEEDDDETKNE